MNEYDYTGDKTKNYFTAYLQKCIRWKRWNYLKKKEKIGRIEKPLEESLVDFRSSIDEMLELRYREEILSREQEGRYLGWNELSDQRLTETILMLREDERRFIYQHIFEERTFREIGCLNGLKEDKVKNAYYYLLLQAKQDNQDAILEILNMYRPLVMKYSLINGILDENLQQELLFEILRYIRYFNVS